MAAAEFTVAVVTELKPHIRGLLRILKVQEAVVTSDKEEGKRAHVRANRTCKTFEKLRCNT